jgi:hypothetical protein
VRNHAEDLASKPEIKVVTGRGLRVVGSSGTTASDGSVVIRPSTLDPRSTTTYRIVYKVRRSAAGSIPIRVSVSNGSVDPRRSNDTAKVRIRIR